MHKEVQQWDIRPRFPVRLILAALIGVLTGVAIAYATQNIVPGVILGLAIGGIAGLFLHKTRHRGPTKKGVKNEHNYP